MQKVKMNKQINKVLEDFSNIAKKYLSDKDFNRDLFNIGFLQFIHSILTSQIVEGRNDFQERLTCLTKALTAVDKMFKEGGEIIEMASFKA